MSLFRVSGLSAGYRGAPTLRDITLPALADGEILGLIGPNAAGKSTLLKCLAGLMRATGEMRLDGETPRELGAVRWRRRVAYMPQTPPQPTSLSAYELVTAAAHAAGLDPAERALAERIETLFLRLGLAADALAPLAALSGGKRQLVGFALALVGAPRLLLLDEPTAALDLRWRLGLLGQLRAALDGRAAIVALHDLNLAARFCDKLALLDQGRVAASGAPEEVLTEETIAAVYRVSARVRRDEDGALAIRTLTPLDDGDPGHALIP